MNIFLSLIIFVMGTFFGSFFTLAVYRIPLKKDITHEHSFCPNCNHKLGILDLFPVFSYIFLKGKCRYCGEKVRIRYLILEIASGLVFLLGYAVLNIQNPIIETNKLVCFVAFVFMYVTVVLIAGIDKEHRNINSGVLIFGFLCHTVYMLYLYIVESTNIYRYIIYAILFVVLVIVNKLYKNKYSLQVLELCSYILLVLGLKALLPITILSMLIVVIWQCITKQDYRKIPIGFVISILAIIYKLIENFIQYYII